MEVARFDKTRRGHRQAVQSGYPEQKTDAMALAANGSFERIIEPWAARHLRLKVQDLADPLYLVLDVRRGPLGGSLRVVRGESLSGSALPGVGHVGGDLRGRDVFMSTSADSTAQISIPGGAGLGGDGEKQKRGPPTQPNRAGLKAAGRRKACPTNYSMHSEFIP